MSKIVAVTACPTGIAHTIMAAEALQQAADRTGHSLRVETQGSVGTRNTLSAEDIATADAVIIAADTRVDTARFAGKYMLEVSTVAAIRDAEAVIRHALGQVNPGAQTAAAAAPARDPSLPQIVAITSCPTGIAHTFMAAEGLESGAKANNYSIKVETQGSVGAQNTLTAADVANAEIVLIAADTNVDLSRFAGKRIYETSTKAAIKDGAQVVRTAMVEAKAAAPATGVAYADQVKAAKAQQSASRTGAYKHLMTGVSYMIPFVVAGGLLIALGFALGGIYVYEDANKGTLAWTLFTIGAKSGFALMVPILAGFIAHSIADRPGLAPGMIGGMIAASIGAGFIGGIAAGFLAGYTVKFLNDKIQLGRNLDGLKPVLILPLLGTAIVGLLMYYVVGEPVSLVLAAITAWLKGLQGSNAIFLGLLLGSMMAFDMGGPVNKAAYAFATGLIASEVYAPMAAVMAAGMTPPLALALATVLFKNRFTADEREAGKATAVLGISFITEGAIPFAAKDPLRVIPALMIGSAVAGALSMVMGSELRVPHGGVFVLPIPNAVTNLGAYLLAIVAGTVVSALALAALKKPLAANAA
ncbi:PTS fructose-like transporter subunit IIB [Rhodoferax fermentans]|uniref:protein-N(pi)-phosphohistidine--D-fructose phosphotransferase n=1 Tax=Rhodoferax fermentans TaxID=28066 RepID=A0A1T1ASW6_RHOFE|nr:PTS fructose-like transporter subunit IIB [Rhodoferax fermentans]MBK1682355.1 PTS fructose transporter subunit EIIBC [Rhodoferax fermentans]OOV07204.1 PTS fructose transporter subunit EIIBC [Rhodoferax fermentans]